MATLVPPTPSISRTRQTIEFLLDPFSLIEKATDECGDAFTLEMMGLGKWIFLCSPELVRQMFKAPSDVLVAGEINGAQLGFMLGLDATFSLDGAAHRQRHKVVYPQLNGRRANLHIGTIRTLTEDAAQGWFSQGAITLLEEAHWISLNVLIHTMFDTSDATRKLLLAKKFDEFSRKALRSWLMAIPFLQINAGPLSPWGKIRRLQDSVLLEFSKEIDEALDGRQEDGTGILAGIARGTSSDGSPLSRPALLQETLNLLFAGHETTGTILTWAIECIATHPEVEIRLREEIDSTLKNEPVQERHLAEMPYLDAVLQESIRFRPIAPMAGIRLAKQNLEMGDFSIPEGSIVAQCFPAMARRPDIFRSPWSFDPDHFFQKKLRPFAWNPFGGGTRMCIGRGLAEVELKVVLATLLQRTRFQLLQDGVRPVRNGFFFAPKGGLKVHFEPRYRQC